MISTGNTRFAKPSVGENPPNTHLFLDTKMTNDYNLNQAGINCYTNDFSDESRDADGSVLGSFSIPSHIWGESGPSSDDEPHIESSTTGGSVALSWSKYLIQRGPRKRKVQENALDYFSSDTRPAHTRDSIRGLQSALLGNVTAVEDFNLDRVGRVLVNSAIQIYGFVTCEDRRFGQVLTGINGILMALELDVSLYKWVTSEMWALCTGVEVRPESLEELGEAMGKDVVKFISTNLEYIADKLIKFCSAATIAPSLMKSKMHYFKNIGYALNKERLTSFASATLTVDGIVSMMAKCISRGIEHLVNWSFPDDINTVLRESTSLRESVAAALPTMDRETRDEMIISLTAMQARLTSKHIAVRNDKFTVAQALLKELDAINKITTRVRNYAVHSMRVPAPLSVMLVGEPAIGKSELTKMLMYIIASVKRPGRDSMPYQAHEICTAPMSKYWNKMSNDTKIVIFDDVNALVKNGETSQCVAANWAEQLIQLVNNQGFIPELAEAHLKGTVQPQLDAVISTANHENRYGNAPGMANVDAVFRRYDIIDVELKDEFKGHNGQIDFNLVAQKDADILSVNPWKMSYKKYNLEKARELARGSATRRGIDPGLWEYVSFTYEGERRLSNDVTLDMLRELFSQQTSVHNGNSDAIIKMDMVTRKKLFPNAPESVPVVQPQAGLLSSNTDWYLFCCNHVAMNCGFYVQTMALFIVPLTSVFWIIYKSAMWAPPTWLRLISNKLPFIEHCRHCCLSCLMSYQLLLLCWGFTAVSMARPMAGLVAKIFGLDLQAIFVSVMFGTRLQGVFRSLPVEQLRSVSTQMRRRYIAVVASLADKERRAKLQRVLVKGVFAGVALGTLHTCAKRYLECRRLAKIAEDFDRRVGPNPVPTPQTTVDSAGNVTVERDPKVDVAPRQVVFKGSYATMAKDRFRKTDPTQTVEDSRHLAGRCMYKVTIRPCTGGQPSTAEYSKYESNVHVFGYDAYTSGTYMVTVAHAFARPYTHFGITLHDPLRVIKEHIICKDDVVLAPNMSMGGRHHNLDLCMFELPNSTTGSLPAIKKLVNDTTLSPGETITRLIPTHDYVNNVHTIEVESGEFIAIRSHIYQKGTPAEKLLPSPVSYWMTGSGVDGMCGSLIMSGGVVVAMHTGSHASDMVTACPINHSLLSSMKARLAGRTMGQVSNARLDDYVIRAPYLEEYTQTELEIDPNVSVRVPGALEPALTDSFYDFIGTLTKDGLPVNVKARTNIQVSSHVDLLMDYLPNVPHILSAYAIPSLSYKMRDTISAFIAKSSIPRPVDTRLLALAKEKVGAALYRACHDIVTRNPGFNAVKVLNLQGGLDGKGFNMAGKVPINTSVGVSFSGLKSDYVSNVYSVEHDEYFISFHEENEKSMEIRDSVYDIIERRKAGEVGLILNFICPKDEVLPVKVDGRTKPMRHINKMDFAHIVVMRMYFQPILMLLGFDPLSCGHSVGLDPTVCYTELIKSLVNGNVERPLYMCDVEASAFVATDYSGFDLSLSGDVISAVMDIFINLSHLLDYTDEDRRVMSSMAYDICNPSVVMLGTIIKMAGVNTSGNPLTTMINCVANMLINCQIHAMIKCDVSRGKYMVDYARDYTKLAVDDIDFDLRSIVTYGDDVVVRVDKGSKITQPATIYYGKQLGYVITGSDKADTVTTYAQDFGFLKRKFNLYVDRTSKEVVMCLAPLAMDSIFKPFVWGDFKKVDINDHYAGLVKSALHELVQHGEAVYELHAPKLWNFVQAFNVETRPRKNVPLIFRSSMKSRFSKPFLSWQDCIKEKYGHSLTRTSGVLTLSELDLIEL